MVGLAGLYYRPVGVSKYRNIWFKIIHLNCVDYSCVLAIVKAETFIRLSQILHFRIAKLSNS